jgi:hypothetical protein
MAATVTPQKPAASPLPPTVETATFGERWAFRLFVLMFLLTLLVGLLHYLFSYFKYQQAS